MNPQQYYEDEGNHGYYQYVTLKQFVDEFMIETTDPDSYLNNTPRSKILTQTKIGIRNLSREIKKTVKAVELTVGDAGYLILPQDYIDWVRVSVVDENGHLQALNINHRINRADSYLQDDLYEILFDDQGQILRSHGNSFYGQPYKKLAFSDNGFGRKYEVDTSKFAYWGEFSVDEERGTIAFSSNLFNRDIVIEYISDGLESENIDEGQIRIHKNLVETLSDWVYSECIQKRRNVPANEKQRARARYKSTLQKCKIDSADFDINQMFRLMGVARKQL